MKKCLLIAVLALLFGNLAFAQDQYVVLPDKSGKKTFKGIISRDVLQKDSSSTWYADNQKGYTPNADAVAAIKTNADSIQLLVFLGTWCSDSHYIIPRFFAVTDAAGFSNERITLIGVDRDKKTLSHLSEALNIKNVPSILVMKNGKELGRVVEYGKYGVFEKELAEIVNSAR
jgi:hypothetical protein